MSKSKQFFLQTVFILSVALIPSLFVLRLFRPVKAVATASLQKEEENVTFLNPLVRIVHENEDSLEEVRVKTAPSFISIPSMDVRLPVTSGVIENNQWTLYDDQVAWLSTSSEPGNGNVILYAHNQKHLFRPLHELKPGDDIILEHDGWEYVYMVSDTHKVEPSDIGAVLSQEEQLTLYTCDGVFDQRRLVVVAKPAESI